MLFAALLSACSSDENGPEPATKYEPIPVSRAEQEIVDAQNNFDMRLFGEVVKQSDKANMVMSPASFSMAFSILANGVDEVSRQEILSALGFDADDLDAANRFNARFMKDLAVADNQVAFAMANSMWANEFYTLSSDFAATLSESYNAEIYSVPLYTEETMNKINQWASDKTHGKIPGIIEKPFDELALFAIMNATYFNGSWASEFDPANTKVGTFHNADGTTASVQMMHNESVSVRYSEATDGTRVLMMPFGNGTFNCSFVLPAEGVSVDEWIASANGSEVSSKLWQTYKADLTMPKFELYTKMGEEDELEDAFKALGVNKIFTGMENCPMFESRPDMKVNMIKQRASFKVNEKGAEAAAVSLLGGMYVSSGPMEKISFELDRPFAFFICEQVSGRILFAGKATAF